MQLYTNNILDRFGNAQVGAQITVRTVAGAIAVIYSDNGATLTANPMTSDTSGEFAFYAANGRYTYTVTASRMQAETVKNFDMYDVGELALPGGANALGFLQLGTGAVTRTVQSKQRDSVSVKDYGAFGNGANDDSGAFQNAVNALPATGGRILVPDAAYLLSIAPNIGIKSIYWDIGTAATFAGAGTGQGNFPYMVTNPAQLAVGPYISSQSRQKSTNSNGGIAAFNVEMLIPDDNGAGQSVGIYAGTRTNNANPLANGWACNFLISVGAAAQGTHQCIEVDVDCNSSTALVKGISISGAGSANPDVGLEIVRLLGTWDRGVHVRNAQDAIVIAPVPGGRAIVVGSPIAQVDTSISVKQAALNADILLFQRFADTGQAGNLMRLVNAANSSNLFIIDISGNISCGIISAIGAISTTDVINGNLIIGNNLRASVGAVPAPVGTLAIGSSLASTATAGGNGAPPAQVAQYIIVYQGATQLKIPAYNA